MLEHLAHIAAIENILPIPTQTVLGMRQGGDGQLYNSSYEAELPANVGPFKEFLEEYSQIPPGEVEAHMHRIRDKAWAIAPYPCFALWGFTHLSSFTEDPRYQLVVSRLTATGPDAREDKLLDVGCGIGQDVRQLAHAGVAPSRLLASDLYAGLLDAGFDMFRDREAKMKDATFLAGDVFNKDELRGLEGQATIVHAANFFHLFSRDNQVVAGARLVQLLRCDAQEAFIFGRQMGSVEAGERETTSSQPTRVFLHDQASFQALWDEIGQVTQTKWKVDVEIIGVVPEEYALAYLGEGARLTRFAVWRVGY